jgi:hypothetical protein
MSGSHQQTLTHMKHIIAESVQAAFDQFDGAVVFVFYGHINPLDVDGEPIVDMEVENV